MKNVVKFLRLELGTVVNDTKGHPWVYTGAVTQPNGRQRHMFHCSYPHPKGTWPDVTWGAVNRNTLINHFPDIEKLLPEETP